MDRSVVASKRLGFGLPVPGRLARLFDRGGAGVGSRSLRAPVLDRRGEATAPAQRRRLPTLADAPDGRFGQRGMGALLRGAAGELGGYGQHGHGRTSSVSIKNCIDTVARTSGSIKYVQDRKQASDIAWTPQLDAALAAMIGSMAESVKHSAWEGRRAGRKPTLATVAEAIGVSRTTASNAYNRPDQLTPELRERILETARRLGYPGPDPAGRRLRQGRAGAIGVLLTEQLSYAFADSAAVAFLEGLARRCEDAAEALALIPLGRGEEAAQVVREAFVDALCIYSLPDQHPALAAAFDRHVPIVVVDGPRANATTFVGLDDRGGARAVAEHLVGLGHRRLAVIVPTLVFDGREGRVDERRLRKASYYNDRERLAGVREALEAAAISWDEVLIEERANRQDAGAAAARSLLAETPRPTALIAMSDQLALGAIRGARELGLEVPTDLSVAGFDDIPEAAHSQPPLTTVRQPLVDKGLLAGDRLFELLAGSEPPDAVLPVQLVARGSTGPAPVSPTTAGADDARPAATQ
jgi:DNA-binding LacI/PurR family transcriptional regulator